MIMGRFALLLICMMVVGIAQAQPWEDIDPTTAGWSADGLEAVRRQAAALKPTAVMIVQDGRVIARWGDTSKKVNMASVRKSLLSAL